MNAKDMHIRYPKEERRRRVRVATMIFIALLNVMFVVAFVWHTELHMLAVMMGGSGAVFTNGFWESSTVKVYHVWMYLMFAQATITSYHLIRLAVKKDG